MKKLLPEELVKAISEGHESQVRAALITVREQRLYKDKGIYEAIVKRARGDDEATRTKAEIDFICGIEARLQGLISSITDKFSSPSEELYYLLWLFEYCHRRIFGLPGNFPFPIEIETRFGDAGNYKSDYDALTAREHFISYFSLVLRSILKRHYEGVVPASLNMAKLSAAAGHFPLASDWNIFHERKTFWERNCARVEESNGCKVVDSSDSPEVAAFRISLSRLRSFRLARRTDELAHMRVRRDAKPLPLTEFRSTCEKTSAYLIHLQFYSEDLSESIYGLELREWLRAYTILKEIASSHAQHEISGCDWRFMLFSARPEYYVERLVNAGVAKPKAEIAIRHFTFSTNSMDILDTPLIPAGKLLLLAPVVTTLIEPAFSLESMLTSVNRDQNHDLAIIGPGLERNIIGSLASANICGVRLYVKQGREEFECDVAFVLNGVLFLCECKGKYEVCDIHDYLTLEKFLKTSAVEQQQRVSKFYQSNIRYVREALGLGSHWNPTRVVDLVITSAKLGRYLEEADVFITDENIFFGYFSRKKTSIRNEKGQELAYYFDDRLEGDVKAESFMDYIQHPPAIEVHRSFLEQRDTLIGKDGEQALFRDVECYGEAWMGLVEENGTE